MGCGGSTSTVAEETAVDTHDAFVRATRWNIGGVNIGTYVFGVPEASTLESVHPPTEAATVSSPSSPYFSNQRHSSAAGKRGAVSAEPLGDDDVAKFVPRYVPKDPATEQRFTELLHRNPLFSSLDRDDMTIIVGALEEEIIPAGTDVLVEGAPSTNKLYCIVDGIVDVIRGGVIVQSFTTGQSFGELELMYVNSGCAATVRVRESLRVLTLDQHTYRHTIMQLSMKKRRAFQDLCTGVPFLRYMTEYEMMTLADALDQHSFLEGEYVVRYGDGVEWMYIIVSGEVKVVGRSADGADEFVCNLGRHETVGELEFLHGHRAVADVICTEPTKTCRIHRAHFELCMGPVKDILERNAQNDKYQYYNKQFATFSFGEGEGFNAFSSPKDPPLGPGKPPSVVKDHRKSRTRRSAVFDNSLEDDPDWKPPVVPKTDEELQQIRSVLLDNPLFRALETADSNIIALAMDKLHRVHGDVLLQEGEEASYYYIIQEGTVAVHRNGTIVATFSHGSGVGEMELLYNHPCVATVRVSSATAVVWRLDRVTYKRIVKRTALERREAYKKLLSNIDFLERMTPHETSILADALSPKTFPVGSYIVRRGEKNEWMYIIVSGVVEVLGVEGDDRFAACTRHICDLERGACVGELEFLNQHAAVADCVAKTEVQTCTLHRDHFEMCMGPIMGVLRNTVRHDKYQYYNDQLDMLNSDAPSPSRPVVRKRAQAVCAEVDDDGAFDPPSFEKSDAQMVRLRRLMAECALFSHLQSRDADTIVNAMEPVQFPPNETIVRCGESLSHLHCLVKGTVVQKSADGEESTTLREGDYFGELQLLYAAPSAYSIISGPEGMVAFRLDRRSFQKLASGAARERRELYRELLSGVPFLKGLSEQRQSILADALSLVKFPPGSSMIRRGTSSEWMYVIVDGVVEVIGRRDGETEDRKVCDLRRGEMVGELEFLYNHPAVATCVAATHVQALRLHRDHFELCLGPVSSFITDKLTDAKYQYYNDKRKA